MRFLGRAAFIVFLLLGIVIAVSNRQPVELSLWPLAETVVMPLFLLVPALLLTGVLFGLLLGWMGGRQHRRNARQRAAEVARLERDAAELRAQLDQMRTAEAAARPRTAVPTITLAPAEARSLERQAALVDPDAVVAAPRLR